VKPVDETHDPACSLSFFVYLRDNAERYVELAVCSCELFCMQNGACGRILMAFSASIDHGPMIRF